jgi:hypothetical protein
MMQKIGEAGRFKPLSATLQAWPPGPLEACD